MALALYLTGDASRVWPMLTETSFGDNGGEPDGNAWLTINYDQAEAEAVVAAGLGEIVEVNLANHEGMTRFLGLHWPGEFEDWRDEQEFVQETLFPAAEDKTAMWSYYSVDGRFIFVEA